ncbi:MAG: cupin domain-containing protein [Candidatus Marinimicrobia bacterium]|nr:cupin domain-containing protein [Candidatus Neomarinimicrobiota bacterium]
MLNKININHNPNEHDLERMGVYNWPIWQKEESEFPWIYDEKETCYFIEGDVVVTPENGEPVEMGEGDLVTFPAGMKCTWKINKKVRKHYTLGEL